MATQLESLDRPNIMHSDDIPRALFPIWGELFNFVHICKHIYFKVHIRTYISISKSIQME